MIFESELINAVALIGVPSIMCLWFMWRTESVIKENTEAHIKNAEIMAIVIQKIK